MKVRTGSILFTTLFAILGALGSLWLLSAWSEGAFEPWEAAHLPGGATANHFIVGLGPIVYVESDEGHLFAHQVSFDPPVWEAIPRSMLGEYPSAAGVGGGCHFSADSWVVFRKPPGAVWERLECDHFRYAGQMDDFRYVILEEWGVWRWKHASLGWGDPGGCYNRAEGAGFLDEYCTTIPLPDSPVGALIGRINEGEPFYVGNRLEMVVPQTGSLSLGINDSAPGDNCGELVVRIVSEKPDIILENLLPNGDFFQGLEFWHIQLNPMCKHCLMEVEGGDAVHPYFLTWERTRSNERPAAMRLYQILDIDLRFCDNLSLSFDVRLDHYNLPNSGLRYHGEHGEYSVKITILFLDSENQRIEWTRGFLHEYDGTHLVNYTLVPPGEWVTYAVDLLAPGNWVDHTGEPLPNPVNLYEFNVSGSGYDFNAAMTNLRLTGCHETSDSVQPSSDF